MLLTFPIYTGQTPKPIDAYTLAESELGQHRQLFQKQTVVCLTGEDQAKLAAFSVYLLSYGHKIILLPIGIDKQTSLDSHVSYELMIHCDYQQTLVERTVSTIQQQPIWDLIYFTSGSTGTARPIGASLDQLLKTVTCYQSLYDVTEHSIIATSLPVTYNFTLVASTLLGATQQATVVYLQDEQQLARYVEQSREQYDRQILLANPVVIQALYAESAPYHSQLLVDSGGAPLSTAAIRQFREHIGDLREGYGLTETCSLTHFDQEGSPDSLGTVGRCIPISRHWVEHEDDKPKLYIASQNIGLDLSCHKDTISFPASLFTGDLGAIDQEGRLRLLGRYNDYAINGYWPHDTLDVIGEILGPRCALVHQPSPEQVIVKLWGELNEELLKQIQIQLQSALDLPVERLSITSIEGGFLHSKKIPRQ